MVHTTKVVTLIAVGVGLLFFVLAVVLAGVTLTESCIFAIGMIVAFVPEGLLPTVPLALAMGTQRIAHHDTLGCSHVWLATSSVCRAWWHGSTIRGTRRSTSDWAYRPSRRISFMRLWRQESHKNALYRLHPQPVNSLKVTAVVGEEGKILM